MTSEKIKNLLSPEEKKVVAKVLQEKGHSSRKLEKWLGLSDTTILRAKEMPTPDELKQFEADFRGKLEMIKTRGIFLGYQQLVNLVSKERKIDQLVKGLDKLEGKSTPVIAQQFNVDGEMKVKFVKYEPDNQSTS